MTGEDFKDFRFDLQLFAGEGGDAAATADSGGVDGGVESPVAPPATNANTDAGSVTPDGDRGSLGFKFSKDENGNPTLEIGGQSGQEETATQENAEAGQANAQQEAQADMAQGEQPTQTEEQPDDGHYKSMEEVLQAAGTGTFDENKLTTEQRQIISAVQQRQLLQMQQQQQLAQQKAQLDAVRKNAFGRIAIEARNATLAEMKISEEDLANADYSENGAAIRQKFTELYNAKVLNGQYNYIQQEVVHQQVFETNQKSIAEVQNFVLTESQREPHYKEIIALMDTAKMDLPYKDGQKVIASEQNLQRGAFTPNDVATMRWYYDHCKKIVYQKANNVTTTPKPVNTVPNVETAGAPSTQAAAPEPINRGNIRNMSQYQRDQVLTAWISQAMGRQ